MHRVGWVTDPRSTWAQEVCRCLFAFGCDLEDVPVGVSEKQSCSDHTRCTTTFEIEPANTYEADCRIGDASVDHSREPDVAVPHRRHVGRVSARRWVSLDPSTRRRLAQGVPLIEAATIHRGLQTGVLHVDGQAAFAFVVQDEGRLTALRCSNDRSGCRVGWLRPLRPAVTDDRGTGSCQQPTDGQHGKHEPCSRPHHRHPQGAILRVQGRPPSSLEHPAGRFRSVCDPAVGHTCETRHVPVERREVVDRELR